MSDILLYFFYIFLFLPINSFVFYPCVIGLISLFIKDKHNSVNFLPKVSILIAAYNEEKVIADRLKNIANLDYDLSLIEVIIGSDCSSDNTNKILTEKLDEYPWLTVHLYKERGGKATILNNLIKLAKNEIVVFTDANTVFNKEALKNLVLNFYDEKIGGVCGKLVLTDDEIDKNESVEEKKYWVYETFIKESESKLGLLFAANGGIFAIRKSLFNEIPIQKAVTDDLFISLSVITKGYKFIYAKDSIAVESVGEDVKTEFKRKIRFSATNFQTMVLCLPGLIKRGFFIFYAFFSHKISRWFLPFNLILLFVFSLILVNYSGLVNLFLLIQSLFYLLAVVGYLLAKLKIRFFIFSLPYFFVVANLAIVFGFIKFIKKRHTVIWESTKR
ncbi:MAG: glycosyltransferase family 2 protein [bacterium]